MSGDPFLFQHTTARTAAQVGAAALGLAESTLQWRTHRAKGTTSDRGTHLVLAVALTAAALGAIRAPRWAPGLSLSHGSAWLFGAGVAVFCAGVALRWWSILTLGRFFVLKVVVQEGHTVVDRGPYRVLRHPSYAGALLIYLGVGLACDNAVSVVACLVLPGAAFLRRIRVEEALLQSELGEPYRAYARRTRRLIPGVW